jgi:LuxR family maltose regulon positive regulatory protein
MAMFNVTAAQVLYSKNELDAALEHATRCVEYAEPVSDIGYLLLGLRLQAFVHESHGESELARAIMEKALRVARQTKSSVRIASTELAAVQLAAMRSELDTVAEWAARRHLDLAEPFSRNFERECLLLARFDMASGRYEDAAGLLAALRPRVAERRRLTSLLTIDVLMASCLAQSGREAEAMDLLASCIEFAGPEGYVRPFVESADDLVDVLFSLCSSRRGVARIHAAKLLKSCELALDPHAVARPVADGTSTALSRREIEVLRLVYCGMTNREIAEQSFISTNTVKTHIKKIYGKLDVTTREEAILRAKELNYL